MDPESESECPPYSSHHDLPKEDEGTLYRDDESYMSDDSFDPLYYAPMPRTWMEFISAPRLNQTDGKKQVFELWKLSAVPELRNVTEGTKVLGINIQHWEHSNGSLAAVPQIKNQSELVDMYDTAIASYEAKNRRSLSSRILRGKAKSYEQDLEKRCGQLPLPFQDCVKQLLMDRESASSTIYRERTWTVVYMQERWFHRFTRPQGKEVKRHKVRFWKNPKTVQWTECYVIIRGAETGTPENVSYKRPHVASNPWVDLDMRERNRIVDDEYSRRRSERIKQRTRSISRPRERSRRRRMDFDAEPPRERRRQPRRDRSFDSEDSQEDYGSRRQSDDFGSPLRRFRYRDAAPSRNRHVPRRFPPAPTPPESFPPPPGVASFNPRRPGVVPPIPPPPLPFSEYGQGTPIPGDVRFPNPFHGVEPMPPPAWSTPFGTGWRCVPPPPPTEFPGPVGCGWAGFNSSIPYPVPPPPPPPLLIPNRSRSLCVACKETPACVHFSGTDCFRPIVYSAGFPLVAKHPSCLDCIDQTPPDLRPGSGFGDMENPFGPLQLPIRWGCGPHQPSDGAGYDEDTATVLDEDDAVSERDRDDGPKGDERDQDGEATQFQEVGDSAPAEESREA